MFSDEDCSIYNYSLDVKNFMKNDDGYNMKLSCHLLKQTFAEGECVASCLQEDENNGDDGKGKGQ